MSIHLHKGDLPSDINVTDIVAVDTETMGLNNGRDRLCVVQLCFGDGEAHIVQLGRGGIEAPNLCKLLASDEVLKIFHYARFDVSVIRRYLGVVCDPIYCTKIASKIARTYTNSHGLKDLCYELLGEKISKQQQSSYWGADELSPEQLKYAASDVLHLHAVKEKLDNILEREGRLHHLKPCFDFMKTRVELDIAGWGDVDIFSHS